MRLIALVMMKLEGALKKWLCEVCKASVYQAQIEEILR